MRQTKIIATVGPASDTDGVLDALIAAGADVFRLNFSHGTHESHAATFARVRQAAARAGREVAVLQDLGGPKIRTGTLAGGQPLQLEKGQPLRIVTGDLPGGPGRVSTTFAGLAQCVRAGDCLLLADGAIQLRVDSTDGKEIATTVVDGGPLGEHKGINAPGVTLPASALTPKDVGDLQFGLSLGVDLVALSFVQTAADLERTRQVMAASHAPDVPLVAKLERPAALDNLDAILSAADAVMVARGDLGLELPLEHVPRAQKEITRSARHRGIPVILATQVLESMTKEPRPTRAEVSDAANAVDDGVDGIMLSGETAVGAYPARCVETLDAIIRDAEGGPAADAFVPVREPGADGQAQALCEAAVTLANAGDAQAIVAVTTEGATARRLSALRPRAPILAVTGEADIARRLALYWGVTPVATAVREHHEGASARLASELMARRLVARGNTIVFVRIHADLNKPNANYVRLLRL